MSDVSGSDGPSRDARRRIEAGGAVLLALLLVVAPVAGATGTTASGAAGATGPAVDEAAETVGTTGGGTAATGTTTGGTVAATNTGTDNLNPETLTVDGSGKVDFLDVVTLLFEL